VTSTPPAHREYDFLDKQIQDSVPLCRVNEQWRTGVRPMIETYPLEKAAEAYARMMSGDAQFRVVLTM
jgi:D-arabinose 1-dehydrogenase-like Zn-dependent alcohol dehydrogenase